MDQTIAMCVPDHLFVVEFFFSAFDMLKDPFQSLEIIIQLGFERILTSGQDSSALEGLPTIKYLTEKVITDHH